MRFPLVTPLARTHFCRQLAAWLSTTGVDARASDEPRASRGPWVSVQCDARHQVALGASRVTGFEKRKRESYHFGQIPAGHDSITPRFVARKGGADTYDKVVEID